MPKKTFPVEIYWTSEKDYGGAWLVNPIGIKELKGRHEKYMQVHGLTYIDFENFGKSPQILCEMLNESFENCKVYVADNELEKTNYLLNELYSVAKIQKKFVLKPLYSFLVEKLQGQENFERLKEKLGKKYIVDGAAKFIYLKDIIELVLSENSF